jgi:hypothetical protein
MADAAMTDFDFDLIGPQRTEIEFKGSESLALGCCSVGFEFSAHGSAWKPVDLPRLGISKAMVPLDVWPLPDLVCRSHAIAASLRL